MRFDFDCGDVFDVVVVVAVVAVVVAIAVAVVVIVIVVVAVVVVVFFSLSVVYNICTLKMDSNVSIYSADSP